MKRLKMWMFGACCMSVMWSISCDDSDRNEESVFSEEEFEWLQQVGMRLYDGSAPPVIEGAYALNSLTIVHDDGDLYHFVHDYTYSFSGQIGADLMLSYSGPQAGDRAENLPVKIYGSDDCFSVVANVEANSNGCDYNMAQVISGCITDSGIADWQLGVVMGSKSGTNCEDMLDENHRRVIQEKDRLAERVTETAGD